MTFNDLQEPISVKGRGQVKYMNLVLNAQFVPTAENVNKTRYFLIKWPWTTFRSTESPVLFDLMTLNDLQEPISVKGWGQVKYMLLVPNAQFVPTAQNVNKTRNFLI
jgi:hypothetical protein